MKNRLNHPHKVSYVLALAVAFASAGLHVVAAERAAAEDPDDKRETRKVERRVILKSAHDAPTPDHSGQEPRIRHEQKQVILGGAGEKGTRERAWLGISTEEAPESLTSQLKLDPGVGLVITYVAEDSPAAKAGLRKNDLLTRFGEHDLVHPAQLRKLVQVRKAGEDVRLEYLRGGEKRSAELTLARLETTSWFEGDRPIGDWLRLGDGDAPAWSDVFRDQMAILRDHLGNVRIDKDQVQQEVKRSLEEARKAVNEALRQAENSKEAAEWSRKLAEELRRSTSQDHGRKSVTVTHTDNATSTVRSLISSDESGTVQIESTPELSLTARDKGGKLLFKGSIDTEEERSKVPRDLWERVEPLLKQLEKEEGSSKPEVRSK